MSRIEFDNINDENAEYEVKAICNSTGVEKRLLTRTLLLDLIERLP